MSVSLNSTEESPSSPEIPSEPAPGKVKKTLSDEEAGADAVAENALNETTMAIAVVLQQQTMRVVRFHVETYQRVQLTISFSKNYPNNFFLFTLHSHRTSFVWVNALLSSALSPMMQAKINLHINRSLISGGWPCNIFQAREVGYCLGTDINAPLTWRVAGCLAPVCTDKTGHKTFGLLCWA